MRVLVHQCQVAEAKTLNQINQRHIISQSNGNSFDRVVNLIELAAW